MIIQEMPAYVKCSGKTILRSPTLKDLIKLDIVMNDLCKDLDYLGKVDEDRNFNLIKTFKWITHFNNSKLSFALVCEIDGRIAGYCSLSRNEHTNASHNAIISLGVAKKYWDLGIAHCMLTKLIDFSERHSVYNLFIDIHSKNERAINLAHIYGFEECGRQKDYYRNKCIYSDRITFHKSLRHE